MERVARQATLIRSNFFDRRKKLEDAIPQVLLVKSDYLVKEVAPQRVLRDQRADILLVVGLDIDAVVGFGLYGGVCRGVVCHDVVLGYGVCRLAPERTRTGRYNTVLADPLV